MPAGQPARFSFKQHLGDEHKRSIPTAGDLVGIPGLGHDDVAGLQQLALSIDDVGRAAADDGHAFHLMDVGMLTDGHTGLQRVADVGPALALHFLGSQKKLLHHYGTLAAHAVLNGDGNQFTGFSENHMTPPFL